MKLSASMARVMYWLYLAGSIFVVCLIPAVVLLNVGVPFLLAVWIGVLAGNVLFQLVGGVDLVARWAQRISGQNVAVWRDGVTVLVVMAVVMGGLGVVGQIVWPPFMFGRITQSVWAGHMSYERKGSGWYDDRTDVFLLRGSPESMQRLIQQLHLTEDSDFEKTEVGAEAIGLVPSTQADSSVWKDARLYHRRDGRESFYLLLNGEQTAAYLVRRSAIR